MINNLLFRDVIVNDVSSIINLFRLLVNKHIDARQDFRPEFDEYQYNTYLTTAIIENKSVVSVVVKDDEIIGFAIGKIQSITKHLFLKDILIGEIQYLIIKDEYKKNGIAKKLLNFLEEKLYLLGTQNFEARVFSFNDEVHMEKVGYSEKYRIYEKV